MYVVTSPAWANRKFKPPFGTAEIDWGHPLARGLVAAVLINEGGGNPYDLVYGAMFTPTGTPQWESGPAGLRINNAGISHYLLDPFVQQPSGSDQWTLIVRVMPNSTATQFFLMFGNTAISEGGYIGIASAGPTYVAAVWSSGTPVSGGTPSTTAAATVVATYDGTNVRLYVDGISVGSPSAATWSGSSTKRLALFATTGGSEATVRIEYAFVLRSLFSDQDVRAFTAEPYALLRPRVRIFYSTPTAATNFVAGGASPAYTGPFQPVLARFP